MSVGFDLTALRAAVARRGRAVRVVVAEARGSSPRAPGAAMLVWADGFSGSVGGGALEWEALAEARRLLARGGGAAVRRFPLGPGLGQCCGGAVTLAFEAYDAEALEETDARIQEGGANALARPLTRSGLRPPGRGRPPCGCAAGDPGRAAGGARRPRAGRDLRPRRSRLAAGAAGRGGRAAVPLRRRACRTRDRADAGGAAGGDDLGGRRPRPLPTGHPRPRADARRRRSRRRRRPRPPGGRPSRHDLFPSPRPRDLPPGADPRLRPAGRDRLGLEGGAVPLAAPRPRP